MQPVGKAARKRSKFEQAYGSYILEAHSADPKESGVIVGFDDQRGHSFLKLLQLTCRNFQLNFSYDANSFIQGDIFESIAEPVVVELLALSGPLQEAYRPFVEHSLLPLAFEMIDRIDNAALWIQFNNAVLMSTRQNQPKEVRKAALDLELHLFNKLGERFLIVLNDALPFLSESLEDDDEQCELAAKDIIKRIESLTGESIQDYLK